MPTIPPWAIVLVVRDHAESAAYFRDVSGFRMLWPEAPDWRLVERDGVRFMLGRCPDDPPATNLGSHSLIGYPGIVDLDGLHHELIARGARSAPPIDQPCGMREIIVATPDGHRTVLGQDGPEVRHE